MPNEYNEYAQLFRRRGASNKVGDMVGDMSFLLDKVIQINSLDIYML